MSVQQDRWLDYWNGDVSLYVSGRHLAAHYDRLLAELKPHLPQSPFTLLDYGCGEALMAPEIAKRGGRVLLYDRASVNRQRLKGRFAHQPGVEVPDDLAGLAGSVDIVLMISVIQYVPKDALPALLATIKGLLKPGGRLILGDILAPDNSVASDAASLLGFGLSQGFLLDAVKGLARTLRSDYRQKRKQLGLSCYSLPDIVSQLTLAGFKAQPLARNIGHAKHRRSVMALSQGGPLG